MKVKTMPTRDDEDQAFSGEMKSILASLKRDLGLIACRIEATESRGNQRFREEARAELVTESYKQLILVNGGAAAGLVTFLQGVRNERLANAMAIAAVVFAFGVVVALGSAIARFRHSVKADELEKSETPGAQKPWWFRRRLHLGLQLLSAICFLVASGYLSLNFKPDAETREQALVVRLDRAQIDTTPGNRDPVIVVRFVDSAAAATSDESGSPDRMLGVTNSERARPSPSGNAPSVK